MDASNSTNPLFIYTNEGTLSNKALKIMGSDYKNLPFGESLTTRIAVTLRNIFRAINCTMIKHSLNNYFINRAVTIIKDKNCQFVKDTFHINTDFHGWCLIERILGDNQLAKNSLIKTGSQFAIIKNIYEDFKEGDKPHFKIAFNCANEMDQIDFLSKYYSEEPAANVNEDNISNENENTDSSLTGTNSGSENEIRSESEENSIEGDESKDESEINKEENELEESNSEESKVEENKKDANSVNIKKIIQKENEVQQEIEEQNVEVIDKHDQILIKDEIKSNEKKEVEVKLNEIANIINDLIQEEDEDKLNKNKEDKIVKTNEELIKKEVEVKQEIKEQIVEIVDDNMIINKHEIIKDEIANTHEELIQKENEVKSEIKEQNLEVIVDKNEPSLIVNADEEKKQSDSDLKKDSDIDEKNESSLPKQKEKLAPDIKEEEQKPKESKENNDKPSEQKETIEPKVKIKKFSIEPEISIKNSNLSTNNNSVINDSLASSQKKRSTKSNRSEKKIVIELEPTDHLHKAFTEEPVLTGLNLFGDFLAPFLNKTNLDIVKNSLQQTAKLLKQHYIPIELVGEAKIKQDIKASTLEVMNQLKSEDFKNLLICLGKEKGGKLTNKNLISGPLNKIQKNTATLKSIAQKSVAVVTNMFSLEKLHVADRNVDRWKINHESPKLLSEKIQDIYSNLDTAFAKLSPTKFALKTTLSIKLEGKVSAKGKDEILNAIDPFIDIFVDHWNQIESKYQIFEHLKLFKALAMKLEKKQFSDSEAAIELNNLLTLTLDKNLDAFYGPLNAFLNPFLNAEHS